MITYTEKGAGLHAAIRAAGHMLRQENGVWLSSNDVAVQAIIDAYDPLPSYKTARITAIKADGLTRINVLYPAITSLDEVSFYADFWLSIALAARAPITNFKKVIDVYTAAKTAIASVNAATTQAQVDAVAVGWPP